MGQGSVKKRRAAAKAKKKGKEGTAMTTDDGASTVLINLAVIEDAASVSETAIDSEPDERVLPSLKAKVCLSAAVEAVSQGVWHKI